MVGTFDLVQNICVLNPLFQGFGQAKIVDAPPNITFACTRSVGPPAVSIGGFWIEMAKAVDEFSFEYGVKSGPFFIGEAGVFTVCFGVC